MTSPNSEAAFNYSTVARYAKTLAPPRRSPLAAYARSPRGQGCNPLTNDVSCFSVPCLRSVTLPSIRLARVCWQWHAVALSALWSSIKPEQVAIQYILSNALEVCRAWVSWSHSHLARGTLLLGIIASLSPSYARSKSVRKRGL
ncbi:uncharacterized protein SCHCODRAFT_0254858 [Schizophyllum commune H4-8]|uniref:Uncharacterized protein n=1 Tax=Schizophyllum commune (strain H4-8 / FGSC 9210) TaxID=578458 RepID=D8PN18_SCHCM|nr:uncharacterized protein SCHCODRAFT_0254858 [Schizophyllum commune H4-8]KAI5893124.1 hypothetical protein SCHCODRAFT_0254858 [Schizophyllum commune H4-8]